MSPPGQVLEAEPQGAAALGAVGIQVVKQPDYLRGQLRLSCPWKPHTLHCPAVDETGQERLS